MKVQFEYSVVVTLNEDDASAFEKELQKVADKADLSGNGSVTETDATEIEDDEEEGDGHDKDGEPL